MRRYFPFNYIVIYYLHQHELFTVKNTNMINNNQTFNGSEQLYYLMPILKTWLTMFQKLANLLSKKKKSCDQLYYQQWLYFLFSGERKNYCIQSAVCQLWYNCSVPSVWSPRGSKGWRSGLPYQECDPLLHLLPPHWMAGTYYSNSKNAGKQFHFWRIFLTYFELCKCTVHVSLCYRLWYS